MDEIAVMLDYYGGFATWAKHGREIAGAGAIARQWAAEIYGDKPEIQDLCVVTFNCADKTTSGALE